MESLELIFGIALLVLSVALIVAVLMQSGKDKQLSGTIAGAADTFFSKQKANTFDKILSKLTPVLAIVFTLIVIAMYLIV